MYLFIYLNVYLFIYFYIYLFFLLSFLVLHNLWKKMNKSSLMIEKKGANSDLKWVKDKDQYVDSLWNPMKDFMPRNIMT